ncbi:uncharacterized protein LOC122350223 isoform X2 [Puntigrus tetrazona]|uniref:uncharacterized protein LOC122350223 isoform X2 n=1 Tax=Puntigrus tetrazona TaxID=1606681 RepID=UPI001C89B515|nr:uncharacterized protein LOC122350223 isoform X2 [Puntigrus tetrazona]
MCFILHRGQFASQYEGRAFITNYNGGFEVKITNLSITDAGRYRCGVIGIPETYEDVQVTISAPLSPISSIKSTVWPSSSPSTPIVSEDDKDKLSDGWRASYTLAAVLSALVFAVISVTLLVCRLKARVKKSTDESEIYDSPNTTLEQNGIIYTMVEFKPFQDPSELYANLQIHNPKDTDAESNSTVTVEESVLYSTIMRAPR